MKSETTTARRGFLKLVGATAAAGFVKFGGVGQEVQAAVEPGAITPVKTVNGQLIDDIIVGCAGTPRDAAYLIEFYKRSRPNQPAVSIPLNARATFRWVPPPGEEIRLGPDDKLEWRVAYGEARDGQGQLVDDFQVVVFTRGRCLQTQRVIVNQCQFED